MEQFARFPRIAQILIVLALGFVLLGVAWFAWPISQQREELQSLQKRSQDLETQIRQGIEAQKRADELQRQIDQILRELEVVKSIIPVEPETGRLLRVFQSFARDQNLVIKGISPKKIVQKELVSEQPYDVEVAGGYHDLAMFFDKLAHMRRVVNVGNLEVKNHTGKGAATVEAKFQSIVYIQNPESFQGLEKKP